MQGLVCGGSLSCTGTQVRSRIVRGTLVPLIPSPQGCRDRCVTCGGWKWRSHTRGSFSLPGLPGRGSSGIRDVYRCEGSRNWIQWQTYPVGAPPPRDRVALHAWASRRYYPPRFARATCFRLEACRLRVANDGRKGYRNKRIGPAIAGRTGYDRPRPRTMIPWAGRRYSPAGQFCSYTCITNNILI